MVRSLKDRLRTKFHLSVAETGQHDVHALAEVTVALVTTDGRQAESILDKADHLVQEEARAVILSTNRHFH